MPEMRASQISGGGWPCVAVLAVALVAGGGGSPSPAPEIAVQIAVAALALLWWFGAQRENDRFPRPALIVAALMLVVPVLQLVPLPPDLWKALPGRAAAVEALGLIGRADTWRPVSLAPARTLAALLATVPAALILLMVAASGSLARLRVLMTVAAGGIATVIVGAAQLTQGPSGILRFYGAGSTTLDGFQANHNSTADVLLIAVVAAAAVCRCRLNGAVRQSLALGITGAIIAVLSLGVVLTASRTGIVLLPLSLAAAAILLWPALGPVLHASRGLATGLAAIAGIAMLGMLRLSVFDRILARFEVLRDMRPELWQDSLFAAQTYFPFGVGIGNFVPALLASERLEVVRETMPNRAHNELLELAVEAGLFGLAAWAAIAALLVAGASARRKDPPSNERAMAFAGAACLAILALHSLVDYPFRSMSLAIAGAACAGLILPRREAGIRTVRSVEGNVKQ